MIAIGARDLEVAAAHLAARLPPALAPLARVAYNYRWSWTPGGREVFREIDPHRWELCDGNPVRLLDEVWPGNLARIAQDAEFLARVDRLCRDMADALATPPPAGPPIAFLCAEFGVHRSLPIYAGGLGVLAGDLLKEASDRGVPLVGVGLLYRSGYFHQQLDASGRQHEFWVPGDPDWLPMALVTGPDDRPVECTVPLWGAEVTCRIWRVDVGRVPLFLLDTEVPGNSPLQRWITDRLYIGNSILRLAQYGVLGIGGIRALSALGVQPGIVHLNEGHAVLAALELAAREVEAGRGFVDAVAEVRRRVVFTTHTPVVAGNERYAAAELLSVFPDLPGRLGLEGEELLALGRLHPEDGSEPSGLTPLGIRLSGRVNGVSRRHGQTAREMWRGLFPDRNTDAVPIGHVTNGIHAPTWVSRPFRRLLERYLGTDWLARIADPSIWQRVAAIPDEELWDARNECRAGLVELIRHRSVRDRLKRGDALEYVNAAERALDPRVLTVGFARRLATYKRPDLLVRDPRRTVALLEEPQPLQFIFAGKAHPKDDGAKRIVQVMFTMKASPAVAQRAVFLDDYDLSIARELVGGCDLWLNLPLPPQEASGTSGMKAVLNGALHLSVLDGWWAEAYDGTNGWAIAGEPGDDREAKDAADTAALYGLLEAEVVPQFYQRDATGIPRAWVARIKASLATLVPRFNTARMLRDYLGTVYSAS